MAVQHPFQTPQNERSFSGLVDQVVLETGKTQALRSVVQYANLSIRECQALVTSERDLVEDQITADADDVFLWDRPVRFRTMRAVKYLTSSEYPKFLRPGRQVEHCPYFYYATGESFAFKGVIDGELIDVAYYTWHKPLQYFGRLNVDTSAYPFAPTGGYSIRPAYYDPLVETWYYYDTSDPDNPTYSTDLGDDDVEETARVNSFMWILEDFYDMILEGTKAKVFKQFNDDRFSASFATYKHSQEVFRRTVGFEAESHENVNVDY